MLNVHTQCHPLIEKIVSGDQTGADRAGLDWAIANNIPHGGWCPAGRLAEDGPLNERYHLTETESPGYRQRTKRNVQDSDGTLILNLGPLEGGTFSTVRLAEKQSKPFLVVALDEGVTEEAIATVREWLKGNGVRVLNIAGPRESKRPGIYELTKTLLERL
jgi:hypothetical protein